MCIHVVMFVFRARLVCRSMVCAIVRALGMSNTILAIRLNHTASSSVCAKPSKLGLFRYEGHSLCRYSFLYLYIFVFVFV